MSRRAWLILAWGILILTIVDGTRFFGLPPYSAHERGQTHYESKYEQHGPERPVLSVLIKAFDAVNVFVTAYEKLLIVLSTIAIAAFTATLWRATTGLQEMAGKQAEDMRKSIVIAKLSAEAARDNAENIKALERAHIHAFLSNGLAEGNKLTGAIMRVVNYGRTPGVLEKLCWQAVPFSGGELEIPEQFPRTMFIRKLIGPDGDGVPFTVDFQGSEEQTLAFCGRAFFSDVFGDRWSSAWAYRMEPKEGWASYRFETHAQFRREQKEPK